MSFGVLKEKVHQLEDFIGSIIKVENEILTRINSGKYKATDIYDYECISYHLSGIFFMLNLFQFDYTINMGINPSITLKARNKEISYNSLKKIIKDCLNKIKKNQIDFISKDTPVVFDNPCLNETVEFIFLYYFYGMKIVCGFFDIDLNGFDNDDAIITLGNSTYVQDNLTNLRREIAKLNVYAKNKIEAYEKIKITNLRIQVLEIRKNRIENEGYLSDTKSTKTISNDETAYLNSRISFFNTELIKFRSELSSNEESLNECLKTIYIEYFGLDKEAAWN